EQREPIPVDFFEVCPENYMRRGGYIPNALAEIRDQYTVLSHGLTMSVGSPGPFDPDYVRELKAFLSSLDADFHSDPLCFGGTGGKLVHDLLPLPFIGDAVAHVVERATEIRERLGRPLVLENISYYVRPGVAEMTESAFVRAILEEADLG